MDIVIKQLERKLDIDIDLSLMNKTEATVVRKVPVRT